MSTTEDKPAIGSPEWCRALPPSATPRAGDLVFDGTRVWTDDKGNVKGQIGLGAVDLTFRTSAQVRDLIGQLATLAGEMDAETARHQPADVVLTAQDRRDYDHQDWHYPATPEPSCWQCGATQATAPLVESLEGGDWQCSNRQTCAGRAAKRAAVRDAEAAQVAR